MLTHTQKLFDYSAIDPTTVNILGFHKGAVLHLAQKSSITSFYNDIFIEGAQYNIHITNPDNISATIVTIPLILEHTALKYTVVSFYNNL